MIIKKAAGCGNDIAILEDLRTEAPQARRAAIERQIRNLKKGEAGEREAAHFLDRQFAAGENVAVFHDLRLGIGGDFAQIDHLLIHRLQATAWVLETKNYAGRLSCDEHGDWTVWREKRPFPIASPTAQAERQGRALEDWLKAEGISWIQRVQPVVLISPTSSVARRRLSATAHVLKSDNFAAWWQDQGDAIGFGTALRMLSRHLVKGMTDLDFKVLCDRLYAAHVPASFDWRAKFGFSHVRAEAKEVAPVQVAELSQPAISEKRPPHAEPLPIIYPGVKILRLTDGRFSVRGEGGDEAVALVKAACRGRSRWVPRYHNWLVDEERMPEVLDIISRAASDEVMEEQHADAAPTHISRSVPERT